MKGFLCILSTFLKNDIFERKYNSFLYFLEKRMSSLQALWYQHPLSVAEELLKQLGESRKKKDIRYVVRSLLEITNVLNSGTSRQAISAFVEYLSQNFVLACLRRKKSKHLRRTVLLRLKWYRQEPFFSRDQTFMDSLFFIKAALA